MLTHFDEKGKIFTQVISKKPVSVIIQTAQSRIIGEIHIRPDDRVKNALDNDSETFLAVTNATVYTIAGDILYHTSFIAVNQKHIVWVIPQENLNQIAMEEEGEIVNE